jgi:hypothetical protein
MELAINAFNQFIEIMIHYNIEKNNSRITVEKNQRSDDWRVKCVHLSACVGCNWPDYHRFNSHFPINMCT